MNKHLNDLQCPVILLVSKSYATNLLNGNCFNDLDSYKR